jgi:hypothetical protein
MEKERHEDGDKRNKGQGAKYMERGSRKQESGTRNPKLETGI